MVVSTQNLTDDEVRRLLPPQELITALEKAFRERFPQAIIPPRTHIATAQGVSLVMSCYDPARNVLGTKFVVVNHSPARPEERIRASYVLLDPGTAAITFSADASYLTDLRTAATSALATKFLAGEGARVLGIFGTGRQARAHIRVMPLVRRFERVLVCGKDEHQSRAFASEMARETGLAVESAEMSTCARSADVICTCTTSSQPVLDGRLLRPGTHVNAVGAFQPHTRELDSFTMRQASIAVDTYDGAMAEAGDLLIPIREGEMARDHVACDLHELVSGRKPQPTSAAQITVFKSVGCALEDLVAAELIRENQQQSGRNSTSA